MKVEANVDKVIDVVEDPNAQGCCSTEIDKGTASSLTSCHIKEIKGSVAVVENKGVVKNKVN